MDGEIKNEKSAFAFRLASRVAVSVAACAIIALGAYFGIQYFQSQTAPMLASIEEIGDEVVAQAPLKESYSESLISDEPEELITGEAGEQKMLADSQSDGMEAEDSVSDTVKAQENTLSAEAGPMPLLYEGDYDLDRLNTDFYIDYADIKIDYRIEDSASSEDAGQDKKSLLFNFIQNKKDYLFSGNIDTVLNDVNHAAVRTMTFTFDNFQFGQHRTEVMGLENNEKSFKLIIYGSFN